MIPADVLYFTLWTVFCIVLGMAVAFGIIKEKYQLLGYFFKVDSDWYQIYTQELPLKDAEGKSRWPIALYTDYSTLKSQKQVDR